MLIQLWNAEKGRDLVNRLIAAAGPHRAGGLDRVFEKLRTRCSWNGARKIEYLEELCEKFAADPFYWPADRPDRVAAARAERDKAIAAIKRNGGRTTRQKLLRHVSRNIIHAMLAAREIVPIGFGTYGLPGAQAYPSTSRKIVEWLAVAPDHRRELDELPVAVERSNVAISAAIKRLRRNVIAVVRGSVIALSPKASHKVKNNEVIRLGNRVIWAGPDQLDLFAGAPETQPCPAQHR